MKNISMNGTKSSNPKLNIISRRGDQANVQEKNNAAIKSSREKLQRRWAAIDAALSINPKMTHIIRKNVARFLANT